MRFYFIIFFLLSTVCFSQKQYSFDYIIEYELTLYKDSVKIKNRFFRERDKKVKKYYLTNSKKNNYTAVLTELDGLNYKMEFKDQNGIHSNVVILKSDLKKAEFLNIECKSITRYRNPFKYQTKNYDFFKLNDTIINGKSYSLHKLASIKPKRSKRKKLGTEFYIIDKETSFHSPILNFSTAYEEWKTKGNPFMGIFFEKYFIDYFGNLDSKEKLINYWKIDKKIIINNDCDYTK
ncbi:hypothetical protein [Flavivirga algicola]|uniref:GLPGLI family protein n=1 Tax=Flavivirga algicola TaxID=2729136 RepID=A0ABX1RVN1_9FLAO|nr:hypothetical protein [Flavivirga algicola]NMH87616.1 hypothetical protein [Flavivirga algicola]